MSSWKFDPEKLEIVNIVQGTWTIPLKDVRSQEDLLHWLLQAAKRNLDIPELLQEFRKAISFCFGIDAGSGAQLLQDLFHTRPISRGGPVDWVSGEITGRE